MTPEHRRVRHTLLRKHTHTHKRESLSCVSPTESKGQAVYVQTYTRQKKIRSSFSRTSFLPVSFFPVASTLKSTCLLFITKMWADHFSKSKVDPCVPMHLYTINHTKSSNPLLGAGKGSQTGRKKAGRQADNQNSTTLGWNTTWFLPRFFLTQFTEWTQADYYLLKVWRYKLISLKNWAQMLVFLFFRIYDFIQSENIKKSLII